VARSDGVLYDIGNPVNGIEGDILSTLVVARWVTPAVLRTLFA